MIGIINYGLNNITSVKNCLDRLNIKYKVISNIKDFNSKEILGYILPGVGSFGRAVDRLKKIKLFHKIKLEVKKKKIPILGICLGMQLLSKFSEENGLYEGLGLIPGCVKKIKVNRKLKIPHVGWNNIFINKKKPILENIDKLNSFYFVHSFSFRCDQKYISSTTSYGCKIISSVQNKHIFGVQFHPEKSQKNGEKIINNFIKYCYK